jgi:5-methylcytosine-specific restriction protein A
MTRRTWTAKRKLALFEAHRGICHICGWPIDGTREAWDVEHVVPVALGGEDAEANCAPAHVRCHRQKTAGDVARIAKAERVRAKHNGAKPARKAIIPGSKASGWKRTITGQTIRRDTQ